jgi:hypothetical protein
MTVVWCEPRYRSLDPSSQATYKTSETDDRRCSCGLGSSSTRTLRNGRFVVIVVAVSLIAGGLMDLLSGRRSNEQR